MESRSISVRTEAEILECVDAAAKAQDRSRNWWINQAIRSALAEERAWQDKVEVGLRAADAGEFVSDKAVTEIFGKFRDAGR